MVKQYNPYLRICQTVIIFNASFLMLGQPVSLTGNDQEITGGTQLLCQSELRAHTVKALCLTEGWGWQY